MTGRRVCKALEFIYAASVCRTVRALTLTSFIVSERARRPTKSFPAVRCLLYIFQQIFWRYHICYLILQKKNVYFNAMSNVH